MSPHVNDGVGAAECALDDKLPVKGTKGLRQGHGTVLAVARVEQPDAVALEIRLEDRTSLVVQAQLAQHYLAPVILVVFL